MKKQVIIIVSICVVGVASMALFITFLFGRLEKIGKAMEADYIPPTYLLINDDSVVVSPKYLSNLRVREITHNKNRNPISLLEFDTTYDLVIYRIDLKKSAPFSTIFTSKIKDEDESVGITYNVIASSLHTMYVSEQATRPVSVLYTTFYGSPLGTVQKSDSLLCYYLQCKNLSVRFAKNAPVDILLKSEGGGFNYGSLPLSVLFLQKNNAVYLVTLSPMKAGGSMDRNLLYNIVTGN